MTWSFPGGHVEQGETHEDALQRELSEELGIQAQEWTFFDQIEDQVTYPDHPVMFHFFVVSQWTGQITNIGDEHTDIRWLERDDAIGLPELALPAYVPLLRRLELL